MGPTNSNDIRIGQQVLHEDDLEIPITYKGEIFTLKYPTPFERAAIESDISRRLGGAARNSFPADHLALVEACAYVDGLLIPDKSPKWFKSAWTCYDETCIGVLYRGYLQFRNTFQERFVEDRLEEDSS